MQQIGLDTLPELDHTTAALAAIVRRSISLPGHDAFEPPTSISMHLAKKAVRNHRIGPLIRKAVKLNSELQVDAETQAFLDAGYQQNIKRQMAQQAALKSMCHIFVEAGIAHWPLKGFKLAHQLYDDPNLRWAKDVDILIAPEQAQEAISLLHQRGYRRGTRKQKTREPSLSTEHLRMRFHKDESYIDPRFGQLIELHQRAFYIEPAGLSDFFRSDWSANGAQNTNAGSMIFYLLLHGAIARWARLKWIIDISLLLRELNVKQFEEIDKLAVRFRCRHAIISSLCWTEQVFPGSLPSDISEIALADLGQSRQGRGLLKDFANAVADDHSRKTFWSKPGFPTPVWNIFDGPMQKIKLVGYVPLAAVVRRL